MLAGSVLAILSACGSSAAGGTYPTYRYRLTVEVDKPEGLRTGSSVIEVHTGRAWQYSIPNPGMLWISIRGEAVSVDLGRRGVLFALLRSEQLIDWASTVLFLAAPQVPLATTRGLPNSSHLDFDLRFKAALALVGAQVIPRDYPDSIGSRHQPGDPPSAWPMMVRFRNLADPKSVEKINPDDLSASFGAGVKLRRITVERTDDPVTFWITTRLPWLDTDPEKGLDNDFKPTTTPTLAQRIAYSDFIRKKAR